jgi:hypothetical protein
MNSTTSNVIETHGLSKSFGPVQALPGPGQLPRPVDPGRAGRGAGPILWCLIFMLAALAAFEKTEFWP